MCLSISQSDFIASFGIIGSIAITSLSINQFIQLKNEDETQALYAIMYCWIISKVLSLLSIIKKFKLKDAHYYILGLIFQCEWYFYYEDTKNACIKLIKQLLFIIIPTLLVNIYLLSDKSRNITNSYFIVMIFLSFLILWLSIIFLAMEQQEKYPGQEYLKIFSMFANFCFFYLIAQSFLYFKYIFISLIILNSVVGIADYFIFQFQRYQGDQIEDMQLNIFYYLFQINIYQFQTFPQKCKQVNLANWEFILRLAIHCINLIILFIAKIYVCPLIIQLDKAFYVFFALSLPQFYLLGVNLYYKLTKFETISEKLYLNEEELKIKDFLYQSVKDRFTQEYKLDIIMNLFQLDESNQQQFEQNIQRLQHFIQFAYDNALNKAIIQIGDLQQSFLICFILNKGGFLNEQHIDLNQEFFDNKTGIDFIRQLRLILVKDIFSPISVNCPLKKLSETHNLLINTQQFNNNEFIINSLQSQSLNKLLLNIVKSNLQVLAFYKNIQNFITINPKHLLFDLYEEDILYK